MYFPTSSTLIEFLILAILESEDSYGYEISQTIKLIAKQLNTLKREWELYTATVNGIIEGSIRHDKN